MIKFKTNKLLKHNLMIKSIFVLTICLLLFSCHQKEKNILRAENNFQTVQTFEQQLSDAAISIIAPTID